MRTLCSRKALNKPQTFEGCRYFSPGLNKKAAYYKISKDRRMAIASAVWLDNLSSNLRIIILLLISKLIFK